jgi:hypothetical protein
VTCGARQVPPVEDDTDDRGVIVFRRSPQGDAHGQLACGHHRTFTSSACVPISAMRVSLAPSMRRSSVR